MATYYKALLALFAVIALAMAAEEEREKKEVPGLGLPGFGYYDPYTRTVLPYPPVLGYPAIGYAAYPGYAAGYRALGYPGYPAHPGYRNAYPYNAGAYNGGYNGGYNSGYNNGYNNAYPYGGYNH